MQNINGFFIKQLEPTHVLAGCIEIYEGAWSNPHQTVELIDQHVSNSDVLRWERAPTVGQGVHQDRRTNRFLPITYMANIENDPVCATLHNRFNQLLLNTTVGYADRYGICGTLTQEEYSLLKYTGGEEYKAHHDGTPDSGRSISAICYLNDDYTGGELEFPFHHLRIKPQAGMLIVFPSSFPYAHIAHPVTQGTKYALVTWIKEAD